MTGRHAGPPLGSEAREATALPYIGRHRCDRYDGGSRLSPAAMDAMAGVCESCGHVLGDDCGCTCCPYAEDDNG